MEINLDRYAQMMNKKCSNAESLSSDGWSASDLRDGKKSHCWSTYCHNEDETRTDLCGQCESSLIQLKFMQEVAQSLKELKER